MSANMKSVKQRIRSVQSTMQITRAMELVASSKLRKAKERAENCRPYFQTLYETLRKIAMQNRELSSYTKASVSEKWCYVVIAGDRGLAGGYNANLFKCLEENVAGKEFAILPIGKKAVEYAKRRKLECLSEEFAEVDKIGPVECSLMARMLCDAFQDGRFGHIVLCCTKFLSMVSQEPQSLVVLPLADLAEKESAKRENRSMIVYEPDAGSVFEAIVPEYVAGLIYGGVCDSLASELAARRSAMEAATGNAEEMIAKLSLHYNRVRQAGITQEITEIIGGAETGS